MKKLFSRYTLYTQLLLSFAVFLAIPLVVIGTLYFNRISDVIEHKLTQLQVKELQNAALQSEEAVRLADNIYSSLMFDSPLIQLFESQFSASQNSLAVIEDISTLLAQQNRLKLTYPTLQDVYVYNAQTGVVISSLQNLCTQDLFYDAGLLNHGVRTTAQILPARAFAISQSSNTTLDTRLGVISFLYPIWYHGEPAGMVVINLYESAVNPFLPAGTDKDYNLTIVGADGAVLSHSQNADAALGETAAALASLPQESGTMRGPQNRLITWYRSDQTKFCYFVSSDPVNVFHDVRELNRLVLCTMALCLVIGLLVSVRLARGFYDPIRQAALRLSLLCEQHGEMCGNELTVLDHAISSVMKQQQRMARDLRDATVPLEQMELLSFLNGKAGQPHSAMHLDADARQYAAAIFVIDRYSAFRTGFEPAEQYYLRTVVQELLQRIAAGADMRCSCAVRAENQIVALFSSHMPDAEPFKAQLTALAHLLNSETARLNGLSFTLCLGGVVGELPLGRQSYAEAALCVDYTLCSGPCAVITIEDLPFEALQPVELFSEEAVFPLLQEGSVARIEEMLRACGARLQGRPRYSNNGIRAVFFDFVNLLQRFAKAQGFSPASLFSQAESPYAELGRCDTVEAMVECLVRYTRALNEEYARFAQVHVITAKDLETFIEANYANSSLDIMMMVDKLGISYSYARKLFKDYFGMTFLQYLNGRRIQKAKQLLCSETASVEAVALAVGYNNDQSFTRFFKKYEAVTPGEYRRKILAQRSQQSKAP